MEGKTIKHVDLSAYQCPEQFVRFKLALRSLAQYQRMVFIVNAKAHSEHSDIARYLHTHAFCFEQSTQNQHLYFTVESSPRA